MVLKARSAKAKGTKLEKWVSAELQDVGFRSRRQPGSGIYSDFAHDVAFELPGYGEVIVECKSWKHGWRTGDNAMGKAELLVIKRDYGTPCVYMPWLTFKGLCDAIEEHRAEAQKYKALAQAIYDVHLEEQ